VTWNAWNLNPGACPLSARVTKAITDVSTAHSGQLELSRCSTFGIGVQVAMKDQSNRSLDY
jgi:hypothetical protein